MASANGSYLYMRGDVGDWVAGPNTYWYTNANATFNASYSFDDCTNNPSCDNTMMASLNTPGFAHWWYVDLSSVRGQPLVPGTYLDAQRSSFRDATHPGMDIFGDGRGCNTVSGDFTVYTADFTESTVDHFRAAFVDHCEGGVPAVRGEIGINVPLPPAPPTGRSC